VYRNQLIGKTLQFFGALWKSRTPVALRLIRSVDKSSAQNELSLITLLHKKGQQELKGSDSVGISTSPTPVLFPILDFFQEDLPDLGNVVRSPASKFTVHCDDEGRRITDPSFAGGASHQFLSQPKIAFSIDNSTEPSQINSADDVIGFGQSGHKSLRTLRFQVRDPGLSESNQFSFVDDVQPFLEWPHPAPTGAPGAKDSQFFSGDEFALKDQVIYSLAAKPKQSRYFINGVTIHTAYPIVAQAENQVSKEII
jgi:hypothetical protein